MAAASLTFAATDDTPAGAVQPPADASFFPLEDIRPGLSAVARTVFDGEEIEEFGVEVLGVFEDFLGPSQDVILARLVGERVQHTGVVAGMSGSPVYVGGRLVGAVAYRFGSFAKEPVAGITPIQQMLPLLDAPSPPASRGRFHVDPASWGLPALPEPAGAIVGFAPPETALRIAPGGSGALKRPPAPPGLAGVDSGFDPLAILTDRALPAYPLGSDDRALLAPLRPIDTPLLFSSLDPGVLEAYAGRLRKLGLIAVQGGGAAALQAGTPSPKRLEPGSTIAAQVVRGDIQISATGTLTYLSEGRVLAFGHPFLRSGATEIPFAPARVLMTVASLENSFKLTAPGDSLGALLQDRLTAVAGRLGEPVRMIPVRLAVRSAGSGPRQVSFEVIQDPLWSPLLLEVGVAGSLVNALDFSLPATVSLRGVLRFEGHPELRVGNLFSGQGMPLTVQQIAARYLTSIFSLLYANRFEVPRVRGLEVEIDQWPERRFMVIEDLWLSHSSAAPGESVSARVFVRPYRGEGSHLDFQLRVPEGLPPSGTLSVMVGGGLAFQRHEQRLLQRRLLQSESLDQMLEVVADLPRYDTLYLRLVRSSEGGVLKHHLTPALPPSVLEVLRSSQTGGDFTPYGEEVLYEKQMALDGAVFGSRQALLRVEGP